MSLSHGGDEETYSPGNLKMHCRMVLVRFGTADLPATSLQTKPKVGASVLADAAFVALDKKNTVGKGRKNIRIKVLAHLKCKYS